MGEERDEMKRVSRRQFTKTLGGAALAVPLAPSLAWPQEAPKKPESPAAPAKPAETPQAEPPKPEPRLKLSKEQEEAVKKAVERRDRQLTAMRGRVLPYDAEPAFVFQVRQRPRSGRKT
jgi:hypothetical protein